MVSPGGVAKLLMTPRANWWPVDKVILAYFGVTTALELAFWPRLPDPWTLLAVHLAGALLIVMAASYPGSSIARIFRYWYPLPYVFYCYKEMSVLIPALGRPDFDAALARLDL